MTDVEPGSCPCGDERVARYGLHLLGEECSSRVVRCVRGFFGAGSSLATSEEMEDAVQECYSQLARPGQLDLFNAPPDRARADAFRGWLYTVVKRTCQDRARRAEGRLRLWKAASARLDELETPLTPDQAGARRCILDRAQHAVDVVRQERWAHGADCGRRFELLLDALMNDQAAHSLLSANLAPTENAAAKAKSELVEALTRAFRDRTRDELTLEPGLDPEIIEDRVDADIEDLFATAYPHQGVPWRELGAHLELSRENSEK
jgi:DNA-directed RNA polymerase specialized sigma24 family protein